jgi:hypothetical protein
VQDKEYCRQRAREARAMAKPADTAMKGILQRLAEDWDLLADRAENSTALL